MTRNLRLLTCFAPLFLLAACQQMPRQQTGSSAAASQQPPATSQAAAQQAAPSQQQAKANTPVVEFRLAQAQAGKNLTALRVENQTLHYQPAPILVRDDLTSVTPMKTKEGQPFVRLQFNQGGAQKLAQVTRQNPGKSLLFTINGQLVGMPRITAPINDGILNLTMNSEAQAINVTNAIIGQQAVTATPPRN
ncbi:MAG: SecDF P1 head subdomain-containing protein [Achromobacter pestifer]